MNEAVVIRYATHAGAAAENQRLVEQVFRDLAGSSPPGLRYATLRLADGVNFVHLVLDKGEDDPLSRSAAFANFQRGLDERLAGGVVRTEATLIGSYRLFAR
jgi:hypothetical protein